MEFLKRYKVPLLILGALLLCWLFWKYAVKLGPAKTTVTTATPQNAPGS